MTKLDVSFFSFTSIQLKNNLHFFSLESCRHQWKPILREEEEEDIKIIFWCMLHPIVQFKNIIHFFSLERSCRHQWKPLLWWEEEEEEEEDIEIICLVHVAPNPTIKKHQSLLGQDHQWWNCYYFSRYHGEIFECIKQMRSVRKRYNKTNVVFDGCLSSYKNENKLNGTHWKI
jgi:hypothetical protein